MKQRCKDTKTKAAKHYYHRGITVCARWHEFSKFFEDMGPKPSKAHTLDRINNDLGYQPGNVRWATMAEQAANRRNNRLITWRGYTKTIREWSRETGFDNKTLMYRIEHGLTGDALFAPRRRHAGHERPEKVRKVCFRAPPAPVAMNLHGEQFGKLTVISKVATLNWRGDKMWVVRCSCGHEMITWQDCLRSGGKKSCGRVGCKLASTPALPRYATLNGVTKHIYEWCMELGIKRGTIAFRWRKGLRDDALLAPVKVLS